MKTLKTLIRLKKDEVDALQKELGQMQDRERKLKDEHDELTAQMQREGELATQFPEMASSFAAYAKKTIDRQKILIRNIDIMRAAIEKKRDELLLEFSEQKKFEIALEQRQIAKLSEDKQRDAKMMDEVALRSFNRKDS